MKDVAASFVLRGKHPWIHLIVSELKEDSVGSSDDVVRQQIAALRVAYVKQLPQRLSETRGAFERWLKFKTAADLFTFYRLTHNLAGSGALYGFEQITEKARAVEDVVTSLLEKKTQATASDIAMIKTGLDVLEETLRRIATG